MSDRLAIAWRWVIHQGSMCVGFVALAFYEVWPSWRGGWWNRVGNFVLPAAGYYAYSDDPWMRESIAYWIKTGRALKDSAHDR